MAEFLPEKSKDWLIAHATPGVNRAIEAMVKSSKIPRDVVERLILDPSFAHEITEGTKKRFSAYLFAVWDKLFEKALDGNVTAIKEYMKRWDIGYQEILKAQDAGVNDDDLPSYDHFRRMMARRYGEDTWRAAEELAKKTGRGGGIFGEQFLSGGELDGQEPDPMETVVEDMSEEDLEELFT